MCIENRIYEKTARDGNRDSLERGCLRQLNSGRVDAVCHKTPKVCTCARAKATAKRAQSHVKWRCAPGREKYEYRQPGAKIFGRLAGEMGGMEEMQEAC